MAKDSDFYKEKKNKQTIKLRELLSRLPGFACDYIYSKEMTSQTSTLVAYCYDLITFFQYMIDTNPICKGLSTKDFRLEILEKVTSEDIAEYQRYLRLDLDSDSKTIHENDKKAIARKMAPLRGLFHYHLIHKNIKEDPTVLVPLPRLKKDKNIIRMSNYEVQAILSAIENGNASMSKRQRIYCEKTKQRDLAILTLMLNTGIRVSECNGLDCTDVDLKVNTITIVRKGGGTDVLYFGDEVHQVLDDYMDGERKGIIPKDGHEKALFLSLQGKRMSVDAIERLVKKYARMVVPNKHITPHKLRSTYGTALYRETGDIRLVADVLGHENINTTIDYYAAIEDEHKKEAANAVDFHRKDQ
ncbi:tyrosine-type recombinase/integrase [Candidatus Weimeria sp. HCP3S3_B5]|uniref:tyrosine-type recombinase/integrase n=1 Tax=Candidatus Weimeria sp. HCP3S3_B5 TaxID=3438871 RepID=UPI003F8BDC0B